MRKLAALVTVLAFSSVTALADCPPEEPGAVAPVAEAVRGWSRYDEQTVKVDGRVDHRASARANGAAFKEEWRALTTRDKMENAASLVSTVPVLGAILAVVAFPFAVVADVADVVVAPSLMVKHGTDAAAHGFLGLFQRARRTR